MSSIIVFFNGQGYNLYWHLHNFHSLKNCFCYAKRTTREPEELTKELLQNTYSHKMIDMTSMQKYLFYASILSGLNCFNGTSDIVNGLLYEGYGMDFTIIFL